MTKYFLDEECYKMKNEYLIGVLETVKKLRWSPDIVHCSGWISHVLPLYLKKAYKDDPIFANSKVVLSLWDDVSAAPLSPGFPQTVLFGGIKPADVALGEEVSGTELAQLAVRYSDGVILECPEVNPALARYSKESGLPVLDPDEKAFADGSYIDRYNAFYDDLLK